MKDELTAGILSAAGLTAGPLMPKKAPWPDFAGTPIHEGDYIEHPNGDRGRVVFSLDPKHDGVSRWRAIYENGESLWLGNQIGDKGRAIVCK